MELKIGKLRFGLWQAMLVVVVLIASVVVFSSIQKVRYEMVRTAYGGQRMTRTAAQAIRNDRRVDWLPDSEFLPEPRRADP